MTNVFSPEYFAGMSTFLVGILTFLTAIATLGITFLMYKVAQKALDSWKEPKGFEVSGIAIDNYGLFCNRRHNLIFEIQGEIDLYNKEILKIAPTKRLQYTRDFYTKCSGDFYKVLEIYSEKKFYSIFSQLNRKQISINEDVEFLKLKYSILYNWISSVEEQFDYLRARVFVSSDYIIKEELEKLTKLTDFDAIEESQNNIRDFNNRYYNS